MAAECYLPSVNGVTMSVIRSAAHLEEVGHTVRIMAPRSPELDGHPPQLGGLALPRRVDTVRSVTLPRYRSLRVAIPSSAEIERALRSFRPDVVHLAAPALFGGRVASVSRRLGIPTVAVFQTDLAGFVTNYRWFGPAAEPIWRWLRRIHDRADLTLAPTPTMARELADRGFSPVEVWGRGVDLAQFDPRQRSSALRRDWQLDGRLAVGFVGRLAAEKRVERLSALSRHPGLRLVIVGDGPERTNLQAAMPDAHFAGQLTGDDLGRAMASLDLFVHTGEHETFCQTIQEAMASGVPVVAPAAGGPLDLVEHGVNGQLYRAGDDADLVATVEHLVTDADARLRLSQAGMASVQNRTWSSIGNQLVTHYRRAVATHAPSVMLPADTPERRRAAVSGAEQGRAA